jgi:hypothetical protein
MIGNFLLQDAEVPLARSFPQCFTHLAGGCVSGNEDQKESAPKRRLISIKG